jgi:phosphoserine phosphatase RsbU/P
MLILVDVSGHGVGSALLAAECWALQRAVFSWAADYRSSLTQINQLICRYIPSDRFITAFIGRLSAECNSLSFLSASHGPIYVLRVTESRIETLPVTGMPLGIMADNRYEQWQTTLFNLGDILIAFTDGFLNGRIGRETVLAQIESARKCYVMPRCRLPPLSNVSTVVC